MLSSSFSADIRLASELAIRKAAGAYRTLKQEDSRIDFCSNDYLGFAQSPQLKQRIAEKSANITSGNGSTGSRLLRGNSQTCEQLEERLAAFHQAPAGLLFNSGYDANLGLFSCLASRNDTVIYDALMHASARDGIRLSARRVFPRDRRGVPGIGWDGWRKAPEV